MSVEAAMLECLERADVDQFIEIGRKINPHLPPMDDIDIAEKSMHYARTITAKLRFRFRAYSHHWLSERGLPSGLPDELRPKAERLYAKPVKAVGISINSSSSIFQPACEEIRKSMEQAVLELHGDDVDLDASLVRQRMFEAREKTLKGLFGLTSGRGLKQYDAE